MDHSPTTKAIANSSQPGVINHLLCPCLHTHPSRRVYCKPSNLKGPLWDAHSTAREGMGRECGGQVLAGRSGNGRLTYFMWLRNPIQKQDGKPW